MMSAALLLAVFDLGAFFAQDSSWTQNAELFAVEHAQEGFVFASDARDVVNSLAHDTCCWHNLKVWESKIYFDKVSEEEKIVRVELSLYNKGDAREDVLTIEGLKENIATIERILAPGERGVKPVKTTLPNGGAQYRRVFDKSKPSAELAWGVSSEVEYLRLTLSNEALKPNSRAKRPSGVVAKAKLKENVTKGPNGDVYIENVPMVDQGQKGYCSAAVSERVLRYYGNRIDEHEIAQQAGTSAEGGTSVSEMKKTVTAIGEKNGLGFQEILSMAAGIAGLKEEIERYNKAAKLEKEPEISLAQFTHDRVIEVGEMRAAMKPKVLFRMRKKDSRLKKFSSGIRQQVNAGIPVFWGVTLGIFPERSVNPQTHGGHMRLIIGYNDKKKEILYTDTWGEGHELKRMPEIWAFTITDNVFFLKPR